MNNNIEPITNTFGVYTATMRLLDTIGHDNAEGVKVYTALATDGKEQQWIELIMSDNASKWPIYDSGNEGIVTLGAYLTGEDGDEAFAQNLERGISYLRDIADSVRERAADYIDEARQAYYDLAEYLDRRADEEEERAAEEAAEEE